MTGTRKEGKEEGSERETLDTSTKLQCVAVLSHRQQGARGSFRAKEHAHNLEFPKIYLEAKCRDLPHSTLTDTPALGRTAPSLYQPEGGGWGTQQAIFQELEGPQIPSCSSRAKNKLHPLPAREAKEGLRHSRKGRRFSKPPAGISLALPGLACHTCC